MRSTRVLLLAAVAAVAVLVATVAVAAAAPSGKCRALAMAGGGDKAAYEAGVIRGLLDSLPAEETSYNVVTGISAGSTLAAAFSVFPVGQERGVADLAETIIAGLNQSSIFRNWPGGVVEGFFKHSSLFDSTPLRDMFNTFLGARSVAADRTTCFGVSNLRTGRLERFCDEKTVAGVINGAVASAAIPGVFIAQQINGETYVDGGVTMNVDVIGAVLQCLKLGYAEENIVVDTIQCGGMNMTDMGGDLAQLTVLPILLRAAQMLDFAESQRAFISAVESFPAVNFRYRIMPTQPIAGSGIDFNRTGPGTKRRAAEALAEARAGAERTGAGATAALRLLCGARSSELTVRARRFAHLRSRLDSTRRRPHRWPPLSPSVPAAQFFFSFFLFSFAFVCACAEMLWMQKLGQQDAFDAVNQPDFTLRVMDQ
jgi:predicted patatin/cPLA2 family phospholipase